jgi:uncharacterized protein (DUF342 family)
VGTPVDTEEVLQQIREKNITDINEKIIKEIVDAALDEPIRVTGNTGTIDLRALGKNRDRDGFAAIISKKDGLYLSVHLPKGQGKKLEYEDVEKYFKKNEFIGLNYEHVRKAIQADTEMTVKLITKSENSTEKLDTETVEISISEDHMEARIILHSERKNEIPIDLPSIVKALIEKDVVYGIDEQKIDKMLQEKIVDNPIVIARGDRDIALAFDIPPKGEPRVTQEGNTDYFLRGELPLVKKGQILATKIPYFNKRSAKNVKGQKIGSKAVAHLNTIRGKNTLIGNNGKELRAAISGFVYLFEGRIHIERESMMIKGNVDPSMGKVHFEGDILVVGSVLPESKVEAKGNLEVMAGVRGSILVSIEGSVKTESCESSAIYAKGDILIKETAKDSILTASGQVSVEGDNGIVGGKITAGIGIKAVNVGARDANKTELIIVNPEAYEQNRELFDIEEKIKDLNRQIDVLGKALNMSKENKRALFDKMSHYFELKREVSALISNRETLEGSEIPKPEEWKIEVSGTMYPSVSLYIGDTKIERKDNLKKIYSHGSKGKVHVSKLSIKRWL